MTMSLRFFIWITLIYNLSSIYGSSEGEVLFHKKYIDGARRTSCAECHNVTEHKLHDLRLAPSDERHRLLASQFLNEGLQHSGISCLRCHQIQKIDPNPLLKGEIKKSHFRNADAACLKCHDLDQKHYFKVKKPGPPLQNSFFRKDFKRERYDNASDAVKDCMRQFQLRENDRDAAAIVAFLRSISDPDQNSAHNYGVLSDYLPSNVSGNNLLGKGAYELSCLPCHSRLKITLFENPLSREGIYRKVRGMSQPRQAILNELKAVSLKSVPKKYTPNDVQSESIPVMPVFSADRLNDTELLNIADYLVERQRGRW